MLFQATNITPSSLSGFGNGVVDINEDLTVSWQVNGNVPMTAFEVTFYENDATSTEIYTTGKLTDGCPFTGTRYNGTIEYFEHIIKAVDLATAGMTNGKQYKFIITQWWSETDSVVLTSAAAFFTRTTPSLVLDSIPSPLEVRKYSFSANYTQEQNDPLNYVKWEIQTIEEVVLYENQIYGTPELRVDYDGFFAGEEYRIKCEVQTTLGVTASTGWIPFLVEYNAQDFQGEISVSCIKDLSGVLLNWTAVRNIQGTVDGEYDIRNGHLVLGENSSAKWDTVSGEPMEFVPPWSLMWRGILRNTGVFLEITSDKGEALTFSLTEQGEIEFAINGFVVFIYNEYRVSFGQVVTVATTGKIVGVSHEVAFGGLYPSTTLYPSATLYPVAPTSKQVFSKVIGISQAEVTISSLTLYGRQECYYLWVEEGQWSIEQMIGYLTDSSFEPTYGNNTLFLANFDNGLNAGNFISETPITGFAIYRLRTGDSTLQLIGNAELSQRKLVDSSVRSQEEYTYFAFPLGEDTFATNPLISTAIRPVLWDWTVLACEVVSDGIYELAEIYRFGKNLTTTALNNNNSPVINPTFTPYPNVQMASTNYLSGSLSSYIGKIEQNADGQLRYYDTIADRNAIFNLSTTQKALFLKNRKGDLWPIRIFESISMKTYDNAANQAQTATIAWGEVKALGQTAIIVSPDNDLFPVDPTPPPVDERLLLATQQGDIIGDDYRTAVDLRELEDTEDKNGTIIIFTDTNTYRLEV